MRKNNTPRIFILYLTYDKDVNFLNLDVIKNLTYDLFPNSIIYKIIYIDNALKDYQERFSDEIILISGENNYLDFSGWDYGFNYLKENFSLNPDDIIFYINDTFYNRNYSLGGKDYLKFFNRNFINSEVKPNLAIGYIDDFPKIVNLLGISYKNWIRSNIFLLSYDLASKLHPLTFPIRPELLFSEYGKLFFKSNEYISENWQSYISSWLFGIEDPLYPEYRLKWLKNEPLSELNRSFFQKKCLAILSEHYLSARIHQMNIEITNTNLFYQKADRHISPYYQ